MDKLFLDTINAFGSMGKAFADFDKSLRTFVNDNEMFNDLTNKGKTLYDGFKTTIKDVYETMSDLKVRIPYDKENDVISYSIDDKVFTVEVTAKDSSKHNVITTSLPQNAENNKLAQKYDETKKVMEFIIPKTKDITSIKNEKIQKLISDFNTKQELLKMNRAVR